MARALTIDLFLLVDNIVQDVKLYWYPKYKSILYIYGQKTSTYTREGTLINATVYQCNYTVVLHNVSNTNGQTLQYCTERHGIFSQTGYRCMANY